MITVQLPPLKVCLFSSDSISTHLSANFMILGGLKHRGFSSNDKSVKYQHALLHSSVYSCLNDVSLGLKLCRDRYCYQYPRLKS